MDHIDNLLGACRSNSVLAVPSAALSTLLSHSSARSCTFSQQIQTHYIGGSFLDS